MEIYLSLILFAISTTLTPGPNNFMILNSGLNFGIRKTLPHYLGVCFGFPSMVLLVSLGLSAVFIKYTIIKSVLKIVGSIYMLYLAWLILRSHTKTNAVQTRKPVGFFQAVLFQWVNPKAWLMAIGAISIFTVSQAYLTNAIIISLIFFLACIPCIGVWLLFGHFLQYILKKDSHRLWFNIVMAVGLVASIVMMMVE